VIPLQLGGALKAGDRENIAAFIEEQRTDGEERPFDVVKIGTT
jgi:hypothetical protein